MSAFMIDEDTLDSLAWGVFNFTRSAGCCEFAYHENRCSGVPGETPNFMLARENALGLKLAQMNIASIRARYDSKAAKELIGDAENYIYSPCKGVSLIQFYKSLRCYLYQCSEGDMPKTEFYLRLEKLSFEVAREIVQESPQYESAKWG